MRVDAASGSVTPEGESEIMFAGKTWWITGASSGIGEALAGRLSHEGARLILSGRNVAALNDLAGRCASDVLVFPFEATDFDALPKLVDEAWTWAETRSGGINGLVNNAGISQRSLAIETVFEVYQRIIAVDLLAPIALTQALLPRMTQSGGDIVAISSVAGIIGSPLRSAYSAAKHGLIGYHDSLRAETAHLGLRVLVVAPGSVQTNVSKNALDAHAKARGVSDGAIDNGMPAETAAARIVEAVRSGERELILAEGMEAEIARLRRSDPNTVFDLMAQLVAGGYAQQMGAQKSSQT
jgi:dehydrogenase/reductase SDR family member 7B